MKIPTETTTSFESVTVSLGAGHFTTGDAFTYNGSLPNDIFLSPSSNHQSMTLTAKNGTASADDFNTALHDLTLNFAKDGTTPIGGDRQVTVDIKDSNAVDHTLTETIAVGPIAVNESLVANIGNTTGSLTLGNLFTDHKNGGTLFSGSDFNGNFGNVLQVTDVSSQGSINVNGNSFVMTDITSTIHNPAIQEAFNFSYQGEKFEIDVHKNGDVHLQNPQDLKLMSNQMAQVDLYYHIKNTLTGEMSQLTSAAITVHG